MYTRRPQFRRIRTASSQRAEYVIEQLQKLPLGVLYGGVRDSLNMVKTLSSELEYMLGLGDALNDLKEVLTFYEGLNLGYWDPEISDSYLETRGLSPKKIRLLRSVMDEGNLRKTVAPLIKALKGYEEEENPYREVLEKIENLKATMRHGARFTFDEQHKRLLELQATLRNYGLDTLPSEVIRVVAKAAETASNPFNQREKSLALGKLSDAIFDYTMLHGKKLNGKKPLPNFQRSFPDIPASRSQTIAPEPEPEVIPEPPRKRRAPARRKSPEPEIIPEPPRKRRAPARRKSPARRESTHAELELIKNLKELPYLMDRCSIEELIKHVRLLSNQIEGFLGEAYYLSGVESALRKLERAGFRRWTEGYGYSVLKRKGIGKDEAETIFSILNPDIMKEDLYPAIAALESRERESEVIPEPPRKKRAPARRKAPEPVIEPEIIPEPPRKRRAPARRKAPEPVIEPEIIPEPPRKKRAPARRKSPAGSKRPPAGMPKGLVELATYAKSRKVVPSYTSNSVILSNGSEVTTSGGEFVITRPNGSTFSSWDVRDIKAIIRQDA